MRGAGPLLGCPLAVARVNAVVNAVKDEAETVVSVAAAAVVAAVAAVTGGAVVNAAVNVAAANVAAGSGSVGAAAVGARLTSVIARQGAGPKACLHLRQGASHSS